MSTTLKGGNLILQSFDVAESVRPGEAATAEVTVSNGALYISPFDDDGCGDSTGNGGYKVKVEFTNPDGSTQHDTLCLPITEIGTKDERLAFTFTAPNEAGDYDVTARMVLPESGSTSARLRGTITVTESDPEEPTSPEPDDGGTGNGGIPGFDPGGDGSGPFADLNRTAMLVLLVVLVGFLAWGASSVSTTTATVGRVVE